MTIPNNHSAGLDEMDEDEATRQETDGEPDEDLSLERRKIFTDKSDPPISSLYTRYQSGDLILDPLFQRREVWEDSRSSRLLESLVLEVPLPIFYLAESADGKEEVIDGQQRLSAFFRFLENRYPLKGLRALRHLNGKHFKELDKATQKLVRDSSVRTVIFKKESDENLRFEIFERLNTGAVPLNPQELRNCVYRGPYNQLLISLSSDPDYRYLMGLKGPEKRMRDVEYVLRFAAFHHCTYLRYKPPIAHFLDEDMRKCRNASTEEQEELRSAFKTAVTLVRSLLGPHAFHRFYRGTEDSPNGFWEQKKFNASLYDILMCSFADKDKNQVMANLDAIREALIALMTDDQSFIDAIELSTSSLRMVTTRFDAWREALGSVLQSSLKQPRSFSRAFKKALYEKNPTCGICSGGIADLDDAAVDHIEQYWLGGKTIPENARLAHRYCNCARPRTDGVTGEQVRRGPADDTRGTTVTPVPLAFGQGRGSMSNLEVTKFVIAELQKLDPELSPKYNKYYVGFTKGGHVHNFVTVNPRRGWLWLGLKMVRSDDVQQLLDKLPDGGPEYDERQNKYWVRLSRADVMESQAVLRELLRRAYDEAAP